MKKITLKLFALVCLLAYSQVASAASIVGSASDDNFTYMIYQQSDGSYTATVVNYSGTLTDVTIPGQVTLTPTNSETSYNCSVTAINSGVFSGKTITSVTLPSSLTSIGSQAFYQCTSLATLDLSACTGLTTIGSSAFYSCTDLTTVKLPLSLASLETIGQQAFQNCSKLTALDLSECTSLTSIGNYAFQACSVLKKIDLSSATNLESIGTYVFYGCTDLESVTFSGESTLTSIPNYTFHECKALTSVNIPSSVTTIGNNAFYYCEKLTTIDIPDGVNSIGTYAFASSGITSIVLPSGVTTINSYTFYNCTSLESLTICGNITSTTGGFNSCTALKTVVFKEGVTSIPASMLASCTYITSITLPSTLITIGDRAFNGCTALTTLDLSGCTALTTIGQGAFMSCSKLTTLTIPATVTSIGMQAFGSCSLLTTATLLGGGEIGQWAFSGCSNLAKLTLGTGVTSIGQQAFPSCAITSLVIPSSVTSIGANAFTSCSKLHTVIIGNCEPTISSYPFNGCSSLKSLTIKNGSVLSSSNSTNLTSSIKDYLTAIYVPSTLVDSYKAAEPYNTTTLSDESTYLSSKIQALVEYPVTISEGLGYATFYPEAEESVLMPDGITAYTGSVNGNTVTLTAIEDNIVPAGTAVLLTSATGSYTLDITAYDPSIADDAKGSLKGTATDLTYSSSNPTATSGVTGQVYTLASVDGEAGFYKYVGTSLAAHKAWLEISSDDNAEAIRIIFAGEDDDETTAIADIQVAEETSVNGNGAIYNLAGQRVNSTLRGTIYIQNGKKFIAK